MPTIKMEQITTLTVSNMDDPEDEQRTFGITVMADWWAQANNISKQMLWRGLIKSAEESWAEADRKKAEAEYQAVVEREQAALEKEADADAEASEYTNPGDDTSNGSWASDTETLPKVEA